MKTGIYVLTFKDDSQYVGRSIDIYRRYKEHTDNMRKGTASKVLQLAYNKLGLPKARILVECHSDHLDLMETYYICKLQPQLNTIGGISISSEELNVLETNPEFLQQSTVQHLNSILELQNKITEQAVTVDRYKYQLNKEQIATFTDNRIKKLEKKLEELREECEESDIRAAKWEHRARIIWWKRIFKWW